jgi:hypothetical protein
MPVSYQALLSGLLALTEQPYAPHPVWSDSTSKPVQFTPLPKKAALRLWQYARDFDRQTKEKGHHGGAIGGVFQNRVTLEAGLMRAGPAGDTLIFSGVVRDGSMCWRGGETAGE